MPFVSFVTEGLLNKFFFAGSHVCFRCHKASKFKCFCCPIAICGKCIYDAEFAIVKGNKGFCSHCSKLALMIEDKADIGSDGVRFFQSHLICSKGIRKKNCYII